MKRNKEWFIKNFGKKRGSELFDINKIKEQNKAYTHYSQWSKEMKFIQGFNFVNDNMNDQRTSSPKFSIEEVEFLLKEYKR